MPTMDGYLGMEAPVRVSEQYLAACDMDSCAAAMLALYESEHSMKTEALENMRRVGERTWPEFKYLTYTPERLSEKLLGVWSISRIEKAMQILVKKGFVSKYKDKYYDIHEDNIWLAINKRGPQVGETFSPAIFSVDHEIVIDPRIFTLGGRDMAMVMSVYMKAFIKNRPMSLSIKEIKAELGWYIGESHCKTSIRKLLELDLLVRTTRTAEQTKDILFINKPTSDPSLCVWCKEKSRSMENHHWPIGREQGGTETVRICEYCHKEYHALERSKVFKPSVKSLEMFKEFFAGKSEDPQ